MKLPPIRKTWTSLVAVVLWLSGAFAAFLTFPIQLSVDARYDLMVGGFSQFAAAALYALVVIYGRRAENQRHLQKVSAILLAISFVLFFTYIGVQANWTCQYMDRATLVKGGTLSADAEKYAAAHPNLSQCGTLIAEYGGDASLVYEPKDLWVRFIVLSLLHTLIWLAVMAIVVLLTYALARKAKRSGAPP